MARTRAPTVRVENDGKVVDIATKRKERPSGMWRSLYAAALRLGKRPPIGGARPNMARPNPFTPAQPLPGVVGAGKTARAVQFAMDAADAYKMALDSGEVPGWMGSAAQTYAASAYAEGQEWLGYAVLAILSQRPEYRIATDIYATDMTRRWIEFKSKSDDKDKQERIDQLVERLTKLRLKQIVKEAIENDGLQGRGQIYIDTGAADDANELKTPIGSGGKDTQAKFGRDGMAHDYDPANRAFPEEVDATNAASKPDPEGGEKKGRIKRLSAIEPMWCYPSQYNADDPLKVDWYRPEIWWVMGKEVHRTRLLTFVSNPVPDMLKPAYSFGGLARTQMMKPYVDFWLRNRTSGSDLLSNFSVPVLSTDLEVTTMEEGSELFQRVMTFNVLRDNQSTMVINKDSEEFNIAAAPLGGVKDLVGQSAEHMCLPGRIPIVKFFGDQPSGLNASSEGVIRLWYDSVHALQESLIREPIQTIVDLVEVELWGETDPDIVFEFLGLWELDDAGMSAVQKTRADQRAVDIQAGVISPEEGRRAAAHDPDSQYSGLDLSKELPPPEEEDPLGGEPSEEETGEEPGGQQHAGARPSRRDVGGLTNRAANFGGAISGGLPTHDVAHDALEGLVRDGRMSLGLAMDVLAALDEQKRDDRGRFAEGGEGGDPANYGEGGSFTQLKPHEREHLFKVGEIAHKHGYRNIPTVSSANHAMWERGGKEDRHVLRAYTYMHDEPGKYQPSWHNTSSETGFTGGGEGHEGLEEHLRELHGSAEDDVPTLDLDDEDFPLGHDMAMDIGKWEEHLHPRAEGGKFAPKGSAAPGHHALLLKHGFEQHPESPHAIYRHKSGHQVAFSQSGMAKGTAYVTGFYKNHKFSHSVSNKKADLEAALAKLDHGGATPSPSSASVPGSNIGHALALADLKKVGEKMGSNPGGTYEAKDGEKFYVKMPQTNDHAKNELLAAALFHAAGGKTLSYHEVKDGDKIGVGTDLASLSANNVSNLSKAQREIAQNDFALHAWLANWDAVGLTGDNVGVRGPFHENDVVPLDFGGSLLYRAQGAPKGMAFGNKADEWDTMRDKAGKNKSAADLYGDMTEEQLKQSALRLKDMTNEKIQELVDKFGPGDKGDKQTLAMKLAMRRNDILQRAAEPSKPKEPPKPKVVDHNELRAKIASWDPPGKPTEAMDYYKGADYDKMNAMFRYLDVDEDSSESAKRARQLRDWLDKASTQEEFTIYRGVPHSDYTVKVSEYANAGSHTVEHGFSSMSTSETFSTKWALARSVGKDSKGILYVIRVPKGSKVATVTGASSDSEYEALAQEGTRFKIIKKHPLVKDQPRRIEVELVPKKGT